MIARAACKAIGWKGDKLPVGHVQSAPAVGLEKQRILALVRLGSFDKELLVGLPFKLWPRCSWARELGEHSTAGV